MISSASTLLLATLVFNAATVFGAPIRIVDTSSESVARAEMSTPVQPVARAAIVDVQDNRRRSRLGHITRRSARLVSERDEPAPEAIVIREPAPIVVIAAPVVESRERRFPRQIYHDFYTKREPAVNVEESAPVPVVKPRERRFPRRALHDLHTKREPATSIKEKTTVVEKITVLDTPADAAAFAANLASSSSASPSTTTLLSISQTTTVASGSSTATDSVSATSTASSASVTASASASSTTDSASVTATPTATSTSTDSASTTASDTSTSSSSGDPTASPSSTSSSVSEPTPTPSPAVAVVDDKTTDVRRGIYIRASTEPILRRLAFSGASWASSVRRQLNTH